MLDLFEELMLLAIDDERGAIAGVETYRLYFGMAGAILAELAIHGKVQVENKKLFVIDETETGDQLLDEALDKIKASKKRKPSYWVNSYGNKKLRKAVAGRLAEKKVIRIEEKRYLWVIPYEVYPQQNASAKFWIKQELRAMLMSDARPEPHSLVLLSLAKACGMLKLIFTKDERRAAKRRVDELVKGEVYGAAVAATIEEIEGAAVAVIAAAS